ncbi:uroporphyrinogen-III synthase [Allosphingosinicella flava]|uniref:Uroporphyrinogen-III synthase n=1 Tax=Allosphingosinicella flava TaxID=2771430 RepID=A0A7T2GIU2_9SPHN|nr:uroporphyrinogen-III synthase [Sphingosinicella flava]QPQ54512.1 uroporphyrinogen-III synthase [Sphingosinicella flava]
MTRDVLILRPEPAASESALRAKSLGLQPIVAPLFETKPIPWDPPGRPPFDAVLMTSANAARLGGPKLEAFFDLPCYAVGAATAQAAALAGFSDIRTGPADGAALARMAEEQGVRHGLHLCGRDHIPLSCGRLSVTACPVYAAEAADSLPSRAVSALMDGTLILLHSPRAAETFGKLVDEGGVDRARVTLAAISPAAAEAAGGGWAAKSIAAHPRDESLLELAARLCGVKVP